MKKMGYTPSGRVGGFSRKRKIRKIITANTGISVSNALSTVDLAVSSDDETLVRIVGNMNLVRIDAADAVQGVNIAIHKSGGSNPEFTLAAGSTALSGAAAKSVLWFGSYSFYQDRDNMLNIEIDVKGQRKQEPADTIEISFIADNASKYELSYAFTLFFKRA